MGLTVKQLIKQLKSLPQNAPVVTRDHDQSECEYNVVVLTRHWLTALTMVIWLKSMASLPSLFPEGE